MKVELDDFDRRILAVLRADARASNLDIAERVALSHSAISRRIRRLEESGVVRGYGARVDPAAVGETVRAFVSVHRQSQVAAVDLARSLRDIDDVVGCWIVSGDCDVQIEVVARDMAHFSEIMLGRVQNVPGVAATRSAFILEALKDR
mgnify:FL=1